MSRAVDLLTLDVAKCPRCDASHPVTVHRLKRPTPAVGVANTLMVFTYWGMCPTNEEPIFMTSAVEKELGHVIACSR